MVSHRRMRRREREEIQQQQNTKQQHQTPISSNNNNNIRRQTLAKRVPRTLEKHDSLGIAPLAARRGERLHRRQQPRELVVDTRPGGPHTNQQQHQETAHPRVRPQKYERTSDLNLNLIKAIGAAGGGERGPL
jgi:hypothetical protein